MEDAAKAVGVSVKTLLRWMKEPDFIQEYRRAFKTAPFLR
jgi:predicted site-specific integrase-resolvase